MTQSEDLTHAPEQGYAEDWLEDQWQDQYGDQYADQYADWSDEHYEDWSDDQYDDEYVHWYEPPPRVRRPWHRNPAVLIGLIAAASAALAVAAVLLLAGDPADDTPTRLKPIIGTTAVSVPPSDESPVVGEPATAESAAETTSASTEASASESASAEGEAAGAQVPEADAPAEAPADAPAPPISARDDGSGDSEGPRINVTRSPMSFTPGG